MADVNFKPGEAGRTGIARRLARAGVAAPLTAEERPEIAFIELLFFAYRDFISDPDAELLNYGFGRAHHRVIHFVNRHPGIRVADLLDILKITKQSLGRVLKQLVDIGFIEQLPGPAGPPPAPPLPDRGRPGARAPPARARRSAASAPRSKALSPAERAGAERFLKSIIDAGERDKVARLIGR